MQTCQDFGNDQSCIDNVLQEQQACQQQQFGAGGGLQAPRPLAAGGVGSWNFFGIGVALMLLVVLPFLIVGFTLHWSLTKWPSRKSKAKDH